MPQVFYLCIKFKTKGKTKHFACQKLEEICTFSFFLMQNIKSNTECGMRLDTTQNRFLERKKNQCYCEFCEATMSDVVSPGDWSQFFFHWVSFQKHT